MSDTSSSPNLLDKDNDNDDPVADGGGEDDSSDEDAREEVVEKKGRSRFQWSHTADCIIENGNMKDVTLIRILLAKEPWNAGHGQVMKAWQNLTAVVLDMVVDGDKIFQGVFEVMLKKRYQLYLDLGKKWEEKRNQLENKEDRDDLTRSTAQLICGGIEDLWEEFTMHKENEKEKKAEESQKEAIAKEGAENIQQFAMGKLRKHDAKGSQKDKDVYVDFQLPTQAINLCLLCIVHPATMD